MPSPKQNLKYLHDVVLPHMREIWSYQSPKMMAVLGSNYGEPDDFINECKHPDDEEDKQTPAVLDFSMYQQIYEQNCNIINDEHNCGRTGCFAGWYVMLSEQQRRFLPWDPSWKAIQKYDLRALATHFNIAFEDSQQLFGGLGDGAERVQLDEEEYGRYDSEQEQCQDEFTQGEVLDIRADYLKEVMR